MIINNYGVVKTSRKNGAHFIKNEGFFNHNEEVLAHCLPFGDPGPDMLKYKFFDGKINFTYLHHSDNDFGFALLVRMSQSNKQRINPFSFLNSLKKIINNDSMATLNGPLNVNIHPHSHSPLRLKNLETIVTSILIGKQVFLLGTQKEIDNFLNTLFESFPFQSYSLLEFTSPTNSLSENTNISGIPLTKSNINLLNNVESDRRSIAYFGNYHCYGNYSSPISKNIAEFILKGDYNKSRNLIKDIYTIAKRSAEIVSNPSSLAKKYKLNIADALLILNLRAKLYNKSPPQNIFEKLIV